MKKTFVDFIGEQTKVQPKVSKAMVKKFWSEQKPSFVKVSVGDGFHAKERNYKSHSGKSIKGIYLTQSGPLDSTSIRSRTEGKFNGLLRKFEQTFGSAAKKTLGSGLYVFREGERGEFNVLFSVDDFPTHIRSNYDPSYRQHYITISI